MWLFKRNKAKTPEYDDIVKNETLLTINSMNFLGQYSVSPNGSYTIAWEDADRDSGLGGFRNSGLGTYVLLLNDEVLIRGRLERPNDGRVANNGAFVINDWMFGEDLSGIFYAGDSENNVLLKHSFQANLLNCGISSEGQFAICQTCNSDNADGGLLCLFDLLACKLLWEKEPETGWASEYRIDTDQGLVSLFYQDLGEFKYRLSSGVFLDKKAWIESKTANGSGFDLFYIAKEKLSELGDRASSEEYRSVLDLLGIALDRDLRDYPNQRATILRTMGEVFEFLDDAPSAISRYEMALDLNSKIGVKRRLDQLRKNS